nr:hypothetical protein GCM10020093_018150 [Planobispora longispora]
MERLAPGSTAHTIAMAERVRGPLDPAALRRALTAVVTAHEVLRWRVGARDGVPEVSVAPPYEVALPVVEAAPEDLAGLLEAEARAGFDLAAGPLLRARLIRLAPGDHVLCLTVHHLVFDGWSQEVLYRDLAAAYRGQTLDGAGRGFADYVRWQRERSDAGALAWWREHLRDAPLVLDLPRDRPGRRSRPSAGPPAAPNWTRRRPAGSARWRPGWARRPTRCCWPPSPGSSPACRAARTWWSARPTRTGRTWPSTGWWACACRSSRCGCGRRAGSTSR